MYFTICVWCSIWSKFQTSWPTISAASLQTKGIVLYNHHPLTTHTKITIVLVPYSNSPPPLFPKCVLWLIVSNQDPHKVHKSCLLVTFLYFLWILQSLSLPPTSASLFSYYWLAEETSRGPVECPAFWNCLITCSLSHLPWFLTPTFPVSWKWNNIQLKHFWQNNFIDDAACFKANCSRIHMKMHH